MPHLDRKYVKQQILKAQTCLNHGLFDEAEEIYTELLIKHRQQLKSGQIRNPAAKEIVSFKIKYFQKQIAIVRKRAKEFWGHSKPYKEAPDGEPTLKTTQLELPDENDTQEVRLREGLAGRYEQVGTKLLDQGVLHDGIGMLQNALDDVGTDESKARIYQKIGKAYENLNNIPAAMMAYEKAAACFGQVEQQVRQKIKPLADVIKQAKKRLYLSCRFPKTAFLISLALAIFFIIYAPKLRTVDNVDYFTLNDDDSKYYQRFKEVFGNDEFFVIAYDVPDLFTTKALTTLQNLTKDLEEIEGLEAATSLGNVDDIFGGEDYFESAPFLEEIPEDKEGLLALKRQALSNQLYVDNLISKDGHVAAIIMEVYDRPEDQQYRERIVEATTRVLEKYKDQVDHFHLAGGTTTNLSLSQYLQEDMAVFIPITLLLVIFTTWLFFRNVILTALALLNICVCVGATVGLMGYTGITLNNVSSIVVPLVMALALCDTVHIFAHLDRQILVKLDDRQAALSYVLKRVYLPCFLTSLTTGIGFLSLSVSELEPIREFAWIACAAMFFEFVFSFFLVSPLLLLFSPEKIYRERRATDKFSYILNLLGKNVTKYSRFALILGVMVIISAVWTAANLKIETNMLTFFKPSSPVRIGLNYVGHHLSGVTTVDVSLKSGNADAFKHPHNLQIIETIQNHIKSISGVDKTTSFIDFIKDMNQSFHAEKHAYYKIPDTKEAVSQYLLLYDSDDIEDFINADFDRARISVRLTKHSSGKNKVVIDKIKAFVERLPENDLEIRLTGVAVDFKNVSTALVNSQIYSLALAALVIAILMGFVFKSVKLGCISLVPNLFPIVLNFGIMGIVGIPLDTGTALIAAIAMGIAVDDTIHFLSEYQYKRNQGMPRVKALRVATLIKGRAIIASSMILCIGFSVLVLSRFVPIIHFGLLCAVIMITAIIGDFVVLPAVILLKEKRSSIKDSCALSAECSSVSN